MVEFEVEDYRNIIRWFEMAFAKLDPDKMSIDDKKTFWKLTFLAEDKIKDKKLEED